jgi:hypothetical protein
MGLINRINIVRILHIADEHLHLAHFLLDAVGNDILSGLNFKTRVLSWIVRTVYMACFGHS